MGKHRKWVQITILMAVIVVGLFTIIGSISSKPQIPRIGDAAPDFTLLGMDGQVHHLSEYKDKVIMINFWGSYCPPCKSEVPALQAIYEQWQDKGVEILGVDVEESKVTVKSFMQQYGMTYPVLLDTDSAIRKKYGVTDYPTTFFIRSNGTIAYKIVGEMNKSFTTQTLNTMFEK